MTCNGMRRRRSALFIIVKCSPSFIEFPLVAHVGADFASPEHLGENQVLFHHVETRKWSEGDNLRIRPVGSFTDCGQNRNHAEISNPGALRAGGWEHRYGNRAKH